MRFFVQFYMFIGRNFFRKVLNGGRIFIYRQNKCELSLKSSDKFPVIENFYLIENHLFCIIHP